MRRGARREVRWMMRESKAAPQGCQSDRMDRTVGRDRSGLNERAYKTSHGESERDHAAQFSRTPWLVSSYRGDVRSTTSEPCSPEEGWHQACHAHAAVPRFASQHRCPPWAFPP